MTDTLEGQEIEPEKIAEDFVTGLLIEAKKKFAMSLPTKKLYGKPVNSVYYTADEIKNICVNGKDIPTEDMGYMGRSIEFNITLRAQYAQAISEGAIDGVLIDNHKMEILWDMRGEALP